MLFILYVDDAICLTPNKDKADKLILDLQKLGYSLTEEGSMSAYLGLHVEWRKDGKVTLTHPGFIKQIIKQQLDSRYYVYILGCVLDYEARC